MTDGGDKPLVPGGVVVSSGNDQGGERAGLGECLQVVKVGLRCEWQIPKGVHWLQAVAHEQQPEPPWFELLRTGELSSEVGVLPVRHGLGRVQSDDPHLGSSPIGVRHPLTERQPHIDSMLSLATVCCQ